MKKESKIILVSGMAITFKEGDKVSMIYDAEGEDISAEVELEIAEVPRCTMNKSGNIVIKHHINTGEYMEYYLTRDKITWAYYSEEPENSEENE